MATARIRRCDSNPNTFELSREPPYLGSARSGRNYLVEMSSAAEHRELADVLRAARATVILSGYDSLL
ncbi:MAG: hypothetical protein ACR2F6_00890 [Mycobacteriales bacterium]